MDQTASVPYEGMGPTSLAAQPVTIDIGKFQEYPEWGTIYNHLESRINGMRTVRWSWWSYWSSLAEFILPRRYIWIPTPNRTSRGSPINNAIVDSTATMAMQVCAAGLWTGLTSPSRPWFKLGIGLPWVQLDADGKAWLEDTEQKVYTVLGQSNFYTVMAQAFQDVATFGTAPVIIYEDFEDIIRCYLPCAGEYYLAAGARLSVDTFAREFTLTVAQIVEMFGVENCPSDIRMAWEAAGSEIDKEYIVAHSIEPNFPIQRRGKGRGQINVVSPSYTFREVYWLRGNKDGKPLSVRGFHERPFMAARWAVTSNDPYGRSPGMDALGDTKQLQQETRRKGEFIDKLVRPPMGANPELKNEPSSIIPGNITYTSTEGGKKGFWPLFEVAPAALAPMVMDLKEIQERIKKCFFVDIFMAITQMEGVQPRNELELTKRDLERLQVLGPFITLFETEFAGPAIQRVLSILERRRLLKPMPASMKNIPLKIDYQSIMKLAQRSSETVSMKDTLATAGSMSAAAKAAGVPDPLRIFDLDKGMRYYADLSAYPSDAIFTPEEVEQHDQARAKNAQAQQQFQATMAGVQAAKTLSETSTAGGTALGALTGAPQ